MCAGQDLFATRTGSITTYLDLELAVAVVVEYIPVSGRAGGWEELYSSRDLPSCSRALTLSVLGNHTDRLHSCRYPKSSMFSDKFLPAVDPFIKTILA